MVIILADDLTGASDTGVQYRKNGFHTIVKTEYDTDDGWEWCRQYEIISINANTRFLDPESAYKRFYELTKKIGGLHPEYIYKKIDSLFRGNPGTELDAVMDATNAAAALVVPSFPENGRKLVNGRLNACGKEGMDVVAALGSSMKRIVAGISLRDIGRGPAHLARVIERKQRDGAEVFILDAVSDEDLEIIRETSAGLTGKIIYCGSAGFAKHLSIQKRTDRESRGRLDQPRNILVVAGTRQPETARQFKAVSHMYQTPIVVFDVKRTEDQTMFRSEVESCAKKVLRSEKDGNRLILLAVSSLFPEENKTPQFGEPDLIRISEALGETVKSVYREMKFQAVVSTGGDTSLQICNALRAEGIELIDEISAGIPIGKIRGGDADGMVIVTKSGGFGSEDALIGIVEYLKRMSLILEADGETGQEIRNAGCKTF